MSYTDKDDYFAWSGIDLQLELKGTATDNPSNVVAIFINRIEQNLIEELETKYFVKETDDEFDIDAFKKAVLHQIDYIRRNGDVSVQSASNIRTISKNAYNILKNEGMCNIAHKNANSIDPFF